MGESHRMSRGSRTERPVIAAGILALISVGLAFMCVGLAYAWKTEREVAACWRAAAMFQRVPDDDCKG